jgi:hypothetical protein
MVQLLVRLVAPKGRIEDILEAARVVMRPAQQARECRLARVYQDANDRRLIEYVEEWETARDVRSQAESVRFARLLELLEMAAECPVLEFRVISETHGLEFMARQPDAAPVL